MKTDKSDAVHKMQMYSRSSELLWAIRTKLDNPDNKKLKAYLVSKLKLDDNEYA